jgi:AcrR family transcriptional regulator
VARQERAERTRGRILDAAAAVFDERGFSGASLSDILARAGVTKGALYFHFSSKEDLAKYLVEEQFSLQNLFGDREDTGLQTAIDLCHEMAHNLRTSVRVRAGMRLVVEANFTAPVPNTYRRWIDLVTTWMTTAQDRGDLRANLEPYRVANWVSATFLGVWSQSEVLTGMADIHERITDMWQFALPGLVPPRRHARFLPSGTAGYGAVA